MEDSTKHDDFLPGARLTRRTFMKAVSAGAGVFALAACGGQQAAAPTAAPAATLVPPTVAPTLAPISQPTEAPAATAVPEPTKAPEPSAQTTNIGVPLPADAAHLGNDA